MLGKPCTGSLERNTLGQRQGAQPRPPFSKNQHHPPKGCRGGTAGLKEPLPAHLEALLLHPHPPPGHRKSRDLLHTPPQPQLVTLCWSCSGVTGRQVAHTSTSLPGGKSLSVSGYRLHTSPAQTGLEQAGKAFCRPFSGLSPETDRW